MPRIPSRVEFWAGVSAYDEHEGRGTVYFEALKKVQEHWGEPSRMADGVWILLNSWHRDFYRFGAVDLKSIATCIEHHIGTLSDLRLRTISCFSPSDEPRVEALFRAFVDATQRTNRSGSQESPVAAAKTLHLTAPGILPLWDNPIAQRFGYILMSAADYVSFCWDNMKGHAAVIKAYVSDSDDRTVLKRIDEFNYAAYTKGWVPHPKGSHVIS